MEGISGGGGSVLERLLASGGDLTGEEFHDSAMDLLVDAGDDSPETIDRLRVVLDQPGPDPTQIRDCDDMTLLEIIQLDGQPENAMRDRMEEMIREEVQWFGCSLAVAVVRAVVVVAVMVAVVMGCSLPLWLRSW